LARADQEAELVARLCRGDRAALEQLYLRYIDRLYSLVFHQVDRDKSVAEDIVHDTFTAALSSIGGFRGRSKFYTWLCAIAHHKIADFYRRHGLKLRRGERHVDFDAIERREIGNGQPPTTSIVESTERRDMVEQCLLTLPLEYRQVLMYRYIEEMPVLEISQVMHRSPRSVEGLLARARQKLRSYLDESGERF